MSDLIPVPLPAPPPRTFWQRRFIDPVVAQLTQGITPEKIALTIAVGSAIAMFPILGTTTLLCLLAGLSLKLNQPIIQVVNYVCTPIHIPLIYVQVRAGELLFGAPHVSFRIHRLAKLLWDSPTLFFREFGLTGFHAIVVWAICAPFWIAAVYSIARPILREIARVRAEALAKSVAEKLSASPPPIP